MYVIPRKGDAVWDAFRKPPFDQPNGKVVRVDYDDEKVVVQFHEAWDGPSKCFVEYELHEFIGCWNDKLRQFHLNT